MAAFSNSDLKKRRVLLKMSAADLAEQVGCDPTTIYKYESRAVVPSPDVMYQIAVALDDVNIWYDWMRTEYPNSYGRLHPDTQAYPLPGALMQMFAEIQDVIDLERSALRDGASGNIDDPTLKAAVEKEVTEALGACQRLLNVMKTAGKG
jgi:transcriptional regulator with XRE-family HTH domain